MIWLFLYLLGSLISVFYWLRSHMPFAGLAAVLWAIGWPVFTPMLAIFMFGEWLKRQP